MKIKKRSKKNFGLCDYEKKHMPSREDFRDGSDVVDATACLLVPGPGLLEVKKFCGKKGEGLQAITNTLFPNNSRLPQPPTYQMLFSTGHLGSKKDKDDIFYFDFPDVDNSNSTVRVDGQEKLLLSVVKELSKIWDSDNKDLDIKHDDILSNLLNFIHEYRFPIGTVISFAAFI